MHISVWHVRPKRRFLNCYFSPLSSSLCLTHVHTQIYRSWTLLSLSAAGGVSLVLVCVCSMNACAPVLPAAPLCCAGQAMWPLSESPVKLLRSSTTPTVSSGNPFASCSLHTPPIPASFPLSLPHMLSPSCLHLLRLSTFPLPLSPLSVCICLLTAFPILFLPLLISLSLCLFLILTLVSA